MPSDFRIRETRNSRTRAHAYTLIDLIVGVAFTAVIAAIALPYFARPHGCRMRIDCTNNLKQIGLAFKQWSLDNHDLYPMQESVTNGGTMELVDSGAAWVHFQVMSNELNTPKVLFCPEEKNSNRFSANTFLTTNFPASAVPFTSDKNTSYFVGVDASDVYPQMWLCGDANLKTGKVALAHGLTRLGTNTLVQWNDSRHQGRGNLCFADGSVQQFANSTLPRTLRFTGNSTNRLAMP